MVLVLVLVPVLVLVLMLVPILALVLGTSRCATQETTNGTGRSTHSRAGDEHLDLGPKRGFGFGHGVRALLSLLDLEPALQGPGDPRHLPPIHEG